jgi:hypothetical protein
MKKKLLSLLLTLLLLLSAAPLGIPAQATFTGLVGIPAGYTAITSIAELNAVRGNLAGKYYLMADLDLAGQAWAPIGQAGAPFTGVFDGNGFAIRNLKAETGQAAGLFGQVSGGVVENLSLVNCEIKATSGAAGGIAGVAANAAIRHCAVTGSVAGKTAAGGIVPRDDYEHEHGGGAQHQRGGVVRRARPPLGTRQPDRGGNRQPGPRRNAALQLQRARPDGSPQGAGGSSVAAAQDP